MCVCACVCVGEIISIPWFSKELKNNLSKNNCLRGVILILLLRESIFVGWGSPFPIVLVPRYKLSLCHTPIKPDYLAFRELVSLRVGCVTMWSWGSHHLPNRSLLKVKQTIENFQVEEASELRHSPPLFSKNNLTERSPKRDRSPRRDNNPRKTQKKVIRECWDAYYFSKCYSF